MLPKPELAYFAIADISGYTSFLAGVELDHAQDIIADFMDTVVKGLRPPFRLARAARRSGSGRDRPRDDDRRGRVAPSGTVRQARGYGIRSLGRRRRR